MSFLEFLLLLIIALMLYNLLKDVVMGLVIKRVLNKISTMDPEVLKVLVSKDNIKEKNKDKNTTKNTKTVKKTKKDNESKI